MYVLDTNTLIYYFKGQGQVAQNIANVLPQEIVVSAIVIF
jgi:tRNA(fMet)-specific endonuclease VapC